MKSSTKILAWLTLPVIILGACDRLYPPKPAATDTAAPTKDQNLTATITSVEAEQCNDYCPIIILKYTVQNKGEDEICLPSLFADETFIHSVISINYKGGGSEVRTKAPSDFAPPPSGYPYSTVTESLIEGPQYVIRPNESREFRVVLRDKFALEKKPASLAVHFASFLCSEDGTGRSLESSDITKDITFTD